MKTDNCLVCGVEFSKSELLVLLASAQNYRVCSKCLSHSNPANDFAEVKRLIAGYMKFAQTVADPELASPQIRIEPADTLIQKAVDLLKSKNPNFFVGVRKIVVDAGQPGAYGYVESGQGKDPTVIHINLQKLKAEVQAKLGNLPQDQKEKEMVRQLAMTIAHEKDHLSKYNPESGFGDEGSAQQAEKQLEPQLK